LFLYLFGLDVDDIDRKRVRDPSFYAVIPEKKVKGLLLFPAKLIVYLLSVCHISDLRKLNPLLRKRAR
jgi:hypothetical protein